MEGDDKRYHARTVSPGLEPCTIFRLSSELARQQKTRGLWGVAMHGFDVLIVESDQALGEVWTRHLERSGNRVVLRHDQPSAIQALREISFDVVVVNVLLRGGSAFLISDEVRAQLPDVPVIFVNNTGFFSDGSLFALSPNARAYVRPDTPPEDLTAMIEHFANSA